MICRECGNKISDDAQYCDLCGAPVMREPDSGRNEAAELEIKLPFESEKVKKSEQNTENDTAEKTDPFWERIARRRETHDTPEKQSVMERPKESVSDEPDVRQSDECEFEKIDVEMFAEEKIHESEVPKNEDVYDFHMREHIESNKNTAIIAGSVAVAIALFCIAILIFCNLK